MSRVTNPSASASKFKTSRWARTDGATALTSWKFGTGRPSMAARALAPRTRYWEARGPAPQGLEVKKSSKSSKTAKQLVKDI